MLTVDAGKAEMSTILNALNKVQSEQQENLRRDAVVRGTALEQRTRKLRESETRREVEVLLDKLREDFRAQLFFLRNENRLLRQALDESNRSSWGSVLSRIFQVRFARRVKGR